MKDEEKMSVGDLRCKMVAGLMHHLQILISKSLARLQQLLFIATMLTQEQDAEVGWSGARGLRHERNEMGRWHDGPPPPAGQHDVRHSHPPMVAILL
nr:hypothetical protein CFP56_04514 [Quercus suber]